MPSHMAWCSSCPSLVPASSSTRRTTLPCGFQRSSGSIRWFSWDIVRYLNVQMIQNTYKLNKILRYLKMWLLIIYVTLSVGQRSFLPSAEPFLEQSPASSSRWRIAPSTTFGVPGSSASLCFFASGDSAVDLAHVWEVDVIIQLSRWLGRGLQRLVSTQKLTLIRPGEVDCVASVACKSPRRASRAQEILKALYSNVI